jgi:hypothetical protein
MNFNKIICRYCLVEGRKEGEERADEGGRLGMIKRPQFQSMLSSKHA